MLRFLQKREFFNLTYANVSNFNLLLQKYLFAQTYYMELALQLSGFIDTH